MHIYHPAELGYISGTVSGTLPVFSIYRTVMKHTPVWEKTGCLTGYLIPHDIIS